MDDEPNADADGKQGEDLAPASGGLSKRAQKRLLKKEKWLEYRPIKRAKEKLRLKQRKIEAKLNNVDLGPSRKTMKNYKMSSSHCKVRVCLDFSFDHLMADKELNKCVNQMARCYSINRRTQNPLQFYVTNFKDSSKSIVQKHSGYANWDVNFDERHYLDLFDKKELVYLSSESDNIVSQLNDTDVYIIGALVDHNSQKGLCLKIAQEQGIRHARLPIDEYVEMKTRKVLTIDHVFSILANVACCGLSWKDSFLKVLPQRKGARSKDDCNSQNVSRSVEANDDDDVDDDLGNDGKPGCVRDDSVRVTLSKIQDSVKSDETERKDIKSFSSSLETGESARSEEADSKSATNS